MLCGSWGGATYRCSIDDDTDDGLGVRPRLLPLPAGVPFEASSLPITAGLPPLPPLCTGPTR